MKLIFLAFTIFVTGCATTGQACDNNDFTAVKTTKMHITHTKAKKAK